ncbi:hypothetical protein [Actinomadura rubrisoli]|uniref:Uncharacterized protein n=1 Tax=Actinomadura rubrisoli TaxID=2530368 RepID=A0A4R5CDT5_9ACTN|nr:hypothetical protein [Actinomadura rubrisoli]TDD97695.1 hypothetical protein E1298_01270 [Actinomadura rubrisoli]
MLNVLSRKTKPIGLADLCDGLTTYAKHCPHAVADSEHIAIQALIETTVEGLVPYWLARPDFVARFVRVAKKRDRASGVRHAHVLWEDAVTALDAGEIEGPVRATRALRLAASMAAGIPVSLRGCLASGRVTGLDLAEAANYAAEDQL